MRYFIIFLLAGYAVRCEDDGYYLIQVPLHLTKESRRQFNVYWNVPTKQCTSKKIPFENLFEKFGIIQNQGDKFRGEELSILYDPGDFPAIFEGNGENKYRNGGVPQNGSLERHLLIFRRHVEESIPNQDFSGVGIIDFESWRPIFRQNFGVLKPYKTVSFDLVRKKHPFWPRDWVEERAKDDFESAAREFMQRTLQVAKEMRPKAVWGYYGFPYCFNVNGSSQCAKDMHEENERISWLWWDSTALFPSVYSSSSLSTQQLTSLIRGRVKESLRVKKQGPLLPYFWYRYRDGGFLRESDLEAAIKTMYQQNTSGFIIWGSSSDVNTVEKCKNLLHYVENIFGPAIAKYTKSNLTKVTVNSDQSTHNPLEADFNKGVENRFIFRDILKNIVLSKYNINENNDDGDDDDDSNLISNETTSGEIDSTDNTLENITDNMTSTPGPGDNTSTSEPTRIFSEKVIEIIEPVSTTETSISEVWEDNIDSSETQFPRFDFTTETVENSTKTPKNYLNMNDKIANINVVINENDNINDTEIFNDNSDYLVNNVTTTTENESQPSTEMTTEFSSTTIVENYDSTTAIPKDFADIYPVNDKRIKCLDVILFKYPICFEIDTGNIVHQFTEEINTDFPSTTTNNKLEEELYTTIPLEESSKTQKVTSASTTVPNHFSLYILLNVILIVRIFN